jgi:hypothetical protein
MDEIERPKAMVLPANAVIPAKNLIVPPPNQFTHEIVQAAPYYYDAPGQARPPDGKFAAGTPVVLMACGESGLCRVADGRGLYVTIPADSLRKLAS